MKKIIIVCLLSAAHVDAMDFSRLGLPKNGNDDIQLESIKKKTVTPRKYCLADLPVGVKNIIALYCWYDQMRHENECQNKRYFFIEDPFYKSKSICTKKKLFFVTEHFCDYYYDKVYTFTDSFNFVEDYSLSRGALLIAQHRSDTNLLALVDKTSKVQEFTTTTSLRDKCFAGSGDGKTIAYVDRSQQTIMEFAVGADIKTAQAVAKVHNVSKTDNSFGNVQYRKNNNNDKDLVLHRDLVFRQLPSYDAWYLEYDHGGERVAEIVCRGNAPLSQVSGGNKQDHLSEYLRYRGVCKYLMPPIFSGKVIDV